MNVLIVGGAGYVGSHMAKTLAALGDSVTVLDNLSTGHRDAVPAQARLVVSDLHTHTRHRHVSRSVALFGRRLRERPPPITRRRPLRS